MRKSYGIELSLGKFVLGFATRDNERFFAYRDGRMTPVALGG